MAGSGSAVVVEVTRSGADAGRLTVTRGDIDGHDALRVVYPGDRIVYERMGRGSRSQISVRPNGTFGGGLRSRQVTIAGSGNGLRAYADVRVQVPAGRTLTVHQGVGDVNVSNVNGTLTVNTASAAVRAQGTQGRLTVDVGSGSVTLSNGQGDIN